MEDYLYIFLAIIWLVISILGGRKKKQQQQQRQQRQNQQQEEPVRSTFEETRREAPEPRAEKQEKRPSRDFEELLGEFFGEETSKTEKPAQQAPAPSYSSEKEYSDERTSEWKYVEDVSDEEISKHEGAIKEDFEFSAEGKVETLEDLIKNYDDQYQKTEEKDKELEVVDLDEEESAFSEFDFNGRDAIIYSEIINRKYF
ncbi:MAG: hypothetical protein ABR597_04190 [Bacteroidales bacterium]